MNETTGGTAATEVPTHSIKLTRNAKQDYQWEIGVRWSAADGAAVGSEDAAQALVDRIDARLRAKYLPTVATEDVAS